MKFYSFFLKHLILPVGEVFFGGTYRKTLRTWKHYDTLSGEELLEIQAKKLSETLRYAIDNVPFYKDIAYDETRSPKENLKRFPILTKELLRNPKVALVADGYDKEKLIKNYSSGSSGVQSFSYSDPKNVYFLQGLNHHWYRWGGMNLGDKTLQFGMSPKRSLPKKLKDFFFRVQYEEAFAPEAQDYERIYRDMVGRKTEFIIGYPSAINQFAEFLIDRKYTHPIKAVISLGDKLFDHHAAHFQTAFQNPKIIDTYGCAEGLLIACRHDLPYYYISAPHLYVEVVDDDGREVEDGQLGHLLITCFTNDAQPFIRYKLGDLGIKLPKKDYPKNRKFNYPLLQKIIGRETDVVKTPHGKTLIVHSFTGIIEYYPDIRQFQVIQENKEQIRILYIRDQLIPLKEDTLENIKAKIDRLTDKTLKVVFEETDFIPPSPSGKPEIVRTLL